MRKNLMVLFFIALLYAGCDKEKEIVNDNLPEVKSTTNVQRIHPENMEDAMNAFILLTNEDNIKDCDDYEAQDALLIMEAALNYHTCTPASPYDEIAMDTIAFEIFTTKDQKVNLYF